MTIRSLIPVSLLIAASGCMKKTSAPVDSGIQNIDSTSVACTIDPPMVKEEILCFFPCEPMPAFPGGEEALRSFLTNNIKYPEAALRENKGGTVFVSFIVDEKGRLSGFRTLNKLHGYGLEEEALRVIKLMPDWKPGIQNGRPVPVMFTLPVRFSLSAEKE